MKSEIQNEFLSALIVALFARAWIEIFIPPCFEILPRVALFARAWIEIGVILSPIASEALSPSLRGRGLKFDKVYKAHKAVRSPSLRGRGLKSITTPHIFPLILVALFARAWIEIAGTACKTIKNTVALFARAWIEISSNTYSICILCGRPLCEGVD